MALRQHKSHYRVKFDDSQASEVDYQTTQVTRIEKLPPNYYGPRFPNLHRMFNHRQEAEQERVVVDRSVDTVLEKRQEINKVVDSEDNIDNEASEYIKRRHQNYLQRLASMNA